MTQAGKVCAWVDVSDTLHPESAAAIGVDLSRLLWIRCGRPCRLPRLVRAFRMAEKPPKPKPVLPQAGGSHPRMEVKGLSDAVSDLLGCSSSLRGSAAQAAAESKQPWSTAHQFLLLTRKTAPARKSWSRLEQALRVTDLLLQAGGFSCIVLDMGSLNAEYALRVPLATWFRFRAAAERCNRMFCCSLNMPAPGTAPAWCFVLIRQACSPTDSTVFTGLKHQAELTRQRFPQARCCPCASRRKAYTTAQWQAKTVWAGRKMTTHAMPACCPGISTPGTVALTAGAAAQSVAVLDGEPPFEHVCSLNDPARTIGIEPGMTKLEMEMFPAAVVLQRSRTEEAAAHAALLECAGTFSPRVEDQSSDRCFTCVIDITGTETLFGSPDTLGENLLKRDAGAWHTSIDRDQLQLSRRQVPGTRSGWRQGGPTGNGMYRACSFATHRSRSFSGARGNLLYVGHHDPRSTRKPCGDRVDCAAWTSGQRAAPTGTGRISAFV